MDGITRFCLCSGKLMGANLFYCYCFLFYKNNGIMSFQCNTTALYNIKLETIINTLLYC